MDIDGRLWLEEVGCVRIWDGQHFIDAPIEDLEATHTVYAIAFEGWAWLGTSRELLSRFS